ncbi:MAG: amino acid permease [Methanotrichaceae archaeon]|nr:amino acid permease [Methanotrichaceae archaeon]
MENDSPALKRELGWIEVTLTGVGLTLGAGIYALIGEASALAGNAVWLAFVLSAIVAILTGLSYAELSALFPQASAEHEYALQAFGTRPALVIGWLIILSGAVGASTVALGFAAYLRALQGVPDVPSGLLLIALLSLILLVGIKEAAWLAIIATFVEVSGLLLVIIVGLPYLGNVDYMEMPSGLSGVFQASALLFFAYQGFEEMVKLSEETRDPKRTIPRALISAVAICILLYVMVAVSAVSIMGWESLGASSAPFAEIALIALGKDAFVLISIIALFATANTVLLLLLASSRMIYGMARSSHLPHALAYVHPTRRTPRNAILVTMAVSMIFVLVGDIALVANLTNFTIFVAFITVNGALIRLRWQKPHLVRPFLVPISLGWVPLLPVLGILSCAFMLIQLPTQVLVGGALLAIIGWLILPRIS